MMRRTVWLPCCLSLILVLPLASDAARAGGKAVATAKDGGESAKERPQTTSSRMPTAVIWKSGSGPRLEIRRGNEKVYAKYLPSGRRADTRSAERSRERERARSQRRRIEEREKREAEADGQRKRAGERQGEHAEKPLPVRRRPVASAEELAKRLVDQIGRVLQAAEAVPDASRVDRIRKLALVDQAKAFGMLETLAKACPVLPDGVQAATDLETLKADDAFQAGLKEYLENEEIQRLLGLAEVYSANGLKAQAAEFCRQILARRGDSEAAAKAKELLAALAE